jgi:anti-sigma factor RsiW
MRDHFSDEMMIAYVTDALDAAAAAELERHVAACADCAARLHAEAELELKLGEVARAHRDAAPASLRREVRSEPMPGRTLAPRRRRGWVVAAASALAIAAAIVLILQHPAPPAGDGTARSGEEPMLDFRVVARVEVGPDDPLAAFGDSLPPAMRAPELDFRPEPGVPR